MTFNIHNLLYFTLQRSFSGPYSHEMQVLDSTLPKQHPGRGSSAKSFAFPVAAILINMMLLECFYCLLQVCCDWIRGACLYATLRMIQRTEDI
mmetsp:Transcript_1276/g.2018  ORF Transcript_1276/g.2018 Transcript_1276/m.2018 type:complete len:93 (-) Transcript_1276:1341-1619(-)|eukprot:CAMPEP_0203799942 /NCGR_PEP_ID=MMETSP0100_2-20121128/10225_1 /ASSEMBLY_ACC=CAM_ASM_000210 /TAXON_ID=96639 /ORGANISM=" , Strain NY0313808BC1" /LENGTH=92 /DNA_ID=CAMNT_0050705937 /DNA_START=199 /DNA_END=477 /DNA_ORIENTATION=+